MWSLVTGTATYIQFPIHPDRGNPYQSRSIHFHSYIVGYAFTDNGRFFVLAERHKSKDTLGIYDAADSYRLTRVRLYVNLLSFVEEEKSYSFTAFPITIGVAGINILVTNWYSSSRLGRSSGGALVEPLQRDIN